MMAVMEPLGPGLVSSSAAATTSSSSGTVLIASEAIGMGLNLSIHRIVISSLTKYDGTN
jgi:ATP-dependent RNA helicase SUPV3L1/SUV3